MPKCHWDLLTRTPSLRPIVWHKHGQKFDFFLGKHDRLQHLVLVQRVLKNQHLHVRSQKPCLWCPLLTISAPHLLRKYDWVVPHKKLATQSRGRPHFPVLFAPVSIYQIKQVPHVGQNYPTSRPPQHRPQSPLWLVVCGNDAHYEMDCIQLLNQQLSCFHRLKEPAICGIINGTVTKVRRHRYLLKSC